MLDFFSKFKNSFIMKIGSDSKLKHFINYSETLFPQCLFKKQSLLLYSIFQKAKLAPIETKIPAREFAFFVAAVGKERPTEDPFPPTATANSQAGLKRIAGFSS